MAKKVLILSGSPRKGGNSDILCDEFLKGALQAGNKAEKIRICEKRIAPCLACYACRRGECAQKDDMPGLLEKMIAADVIVLASPLYFYSVSAQMKALIDRCLARWTELKDKELCYIITAAQNDPGVTETAVACFRGLAKCIAGSKERGILRAVGVHQPGEVKKTAYPEEARKMGEML